MPAERLSDVLDTLIRQSFLDCQIERHDGETEPFDPITLFYSLIESEIDVRNATILFDIIVQKIEKNRAGSGLSRISHQDLHDRVASAILGYKHPLASFWLSNYEGMFAPEIDHADDTAEYIDARNAGILRGEIRYFLEGKRDGVVSDATVLRDITNRPIRLIKFCGFHKLRRDFLQLLLAELSISSTNSFLPNIAISDKSFTERLDQVERKLLTIHELAPDQRSNFCSAVSATLTAAILGRLGVIHSAATNKSLRHVKSLLDDFYRRDKAAEISSSDGVAALRALRGRLDELLGRANLKPIIFLDTVDAAIDAQTRGHIGEFIFFLEKIVRYFRMLATDSELLRTLGTFHFDEDPTNYLRAVERCFEEDGFEVEQVDRNELNVQITARFHKIIEFGDTLKIRIVTEPLDEFSFDWIEQQAERYPSALFCLLIERNLGGAFFGGST